MPVIIKFTGALAGIFALLFAGTLFLLYEDQSQAPPLGKLEPTNKKVENSTGTSARLFSSEKVVATSSTTTVQSIKPSVAKNTPTQSKEKISPKQNTSVSTPGPLYITNPAAVSAGKTTTTTATTSPNPVVPNQDGALNQNDILLRVNKERTAVGLKPLQFNKKLTDIAIAKANDMIANKYFAHNAPDGTDVVKLAARYGYDYLNIGENLALGDFISSDDVMDGWMESPGHKANILNKNYTEIGVSAILGDYEGRLVWYAVQEFGRPASACPKPDSLLTAKIADTEATIGTLLGTLNLLRDSMGDPNIEKATYNKLVEEYNAVVAIYNDYVATIKADIAKHNEEVDVFNYCIKTP